VPPPTVLADGQPASTATEVASAPKPAKPLPALPTVDVDVEVELPSLPPLPVELPKLPVELPKPVLPVTVP
jgi:hypothetical protein